jgi:hypothetical protein
MTPAVDAGTSGSDMLRKDHPMRTTTIARARYIFKETLQ